MPSKRSSRKKAQKFYCVHCNKRLWRQAVEKYYLVYEKVSDIKENLNISHKRASLIAANNRGYLDTNSWIEECFCKECGKIWLLVPKSLMASLKLLLQEAKIGIGQLRPLILMLLIHQLANLVVV